MPVETFDNRSTKDNVAYLLKHSTDSVPLNANVEQMLFGGEFDPQEFLENIGESDLIAQAVQRDLESAEAFAAAYQEQGHAPMTSADDFSMSDDLLSNLAGATSNMGGSGEWGQDFGLLHLHPYDEQVTIDQLPPSAFNTNYAPMMNMPPSTNHLAFAPVKSEASYYQNQFPVLAPLPVANSAPPAFLAPVAPASRKRVAETPLEGPAPQEKKARVQSGVFKARKRNIERDLREQLAALQADSVSFDAKSRAAENVLERLQVENQLLRARQAQASAAVCHDRHNQVQILAAQLENPKVTDAQLRETLGKIDGACGNVIALGQRHLHEILSPSVVSTLVANGIFDTPSRQCPVSGRESQVCPGTLNSCSENCASLYTLRDKIVEKVPDVTENQQRLMDEALERHERKALVLRAEAVRVAAEIKQAFGEGFRAYSATKATTGLDYSLENSSSLVRVVKPVATLQHLRRLLDAEAMEWQAAFNDITNVLLTTRQRAHFIMKVEFVHASVRQLSRFWGALQQAWRPLAGADAI